MEDEAKNYLKKKKLEFIFYRSASGREPVAEFIESRKQEEQDKIIERISVVEYGFPLGRPVCAHVRGKIWECRISLNNNVQCRILFAPIKGEMVGLHAIIKKQNKVPDRDYKTAKKRLKDFLDSS